MASFAGMQALIVFSRVGVYMRLPGVDIEKFSETVQSGGILGYIDALSGGSISRVGIFSLGEDFKALAQAPLHLHKQGCTVDCGRFEQALFLTSTPPSSFSFWRPLSHL